MIKSVNAILIESSNVSRSMEFYLGLGLSLKANDHGGGIHAEAEIGDCHFAIFPGGKELSEKPNVQFSFHVPNLEEVYEYLSKKGYNFTLPPESKPFGGVVAELLDPDGNRVILMRWDSDK